MPSVKLITLLLLFTLLLTACDGDTPSPTGISQPTTVSVVATDTPAIPPTATPTPEPTATPVPLAARVNGEALTLAEFEAEMARYQASLQETGTNLATDAQQVVLDELINQLLLAQSARQQGFTVDDSTLQAAHEQPDHTTWRGGRCWTGWRGMAAKGRFSPGAQALRRSCLDRDQIASGVPSTANRHTLARFCYIILIRRTRCTISCSQATTSPPWLPSISADEWRPGLVPAWLPDPACPGRSGFQP
jgi:hypothetical protein